MFTVINTLHLLTSHATTLDTIYRNATNARTRKIHSS